MKLPCARVLTSLWLGLGLAASAHEDPKKDTKVLTEAMQREGATVANLCERALRWRSLRKLDLAIKDWQAALDIDATCFEAWHGLARAQLSEGNLKTAFATLEKSLQGETIAEPGDRARLHMLRAEVWLLWRSYPKAAVDCEQAFKLLPTHRRIDWHLKRAYIQRMQGEFVACEKGLAAAYEEIPSIVLYTQWVDALIDAKQFDKAAEEIAKQIPGLRFSGPWQLRLARVWRAKGKETEAKIAERRAEEEFATRIKEAEDKLDVTLYMDRAHLRLQLGQRKGARQDYASAKASGADGWMLWRLEKAFR